MTTENGNYQPEDDLDDTFEQDLRDMLRDGPSLSDAAATIQSGTSAKGGSGGQFTGVDLSSPQKSPMSSPPQPRVIQNPSVGSRLAHPAGGAGRLSSLPSITPKYFKADFCVSFSYMEMTLKKDYMPLVFGTHCLIQLY